MHDPRPTELSVDDQILARMYADERRPLKEIAEELGLSVAELPDRLAQMAHQVQRLKRRAS
jgi:DNA-binding Lrp family transcriptional regulator